jgi:crotonobetainyl-CoA:carnitine CoA-transferase CaiB-like acyl-CoA transferase
MAELPLKGIRVIDLSMIFAGPLCARVLADLGAEVIKIEAIQRPDAVRALGLADNKALDIGFAQGGYFVELNMNKREITLDLNNPKGQELLKRLLLISDVLIENYSPGTMAKFGFDYERVREIRPEMVMASLSGYGQTGPWANWGAFGYTLEYACGLGSVTGYPGGLPRKQGISFTDPWAGILAAGLIVVALHNRRRTGRGQYIDMSQRDVGSAFLGEALMDCEMNGRVWGRIGNRHPAMAPHGQYRCRGEREWIVLAVSNDEEWRGLCRVLGEPEWAKDRRFATVEGRLAEQNFIDQRIEEWTQQRDHYTAMHELQAAGVPAGPVLNGKEILLDPHYKARGLMEVVENHVVGRRMHMRQTPGWFSAWPKAGTSPTPAPTLGQHNEEILGGLLGLSKEEIQTLADEQVIGVETIIEKLPVEVTQEILNRRLQMMQMVGKVEKIEPDYMQQLGIDGAE